jgi:hypothetical protein
LEVISKKRSKYSKGVTEDDITENAVTLVFSRTGKSYNQKTLYPEDDISGKRYNLKMIEPEIL